MKRFSALFLVIVFTSITNVSANISITEINWMGSSESQFSEWIEFYNDSDKEVNLAGWKLYESGGDTLIFTLTKTISSKGYLLLERITTSSPDPVPGVNDESGSFGGSGLSNNGEYIVLKDSSGAIKQSLNFSSGWPAGDTENKKTMQWDGAKWITATPTPKAKTASSSGDTVEETKPKEVSIAWSNPKTEPHLEVFIPSNIYVGVTEKYLAKTFLDYGEIYSGVFLWNMGDGTVYKSIKPIDIKHSYKYPGFYTISFAYYKNYYDKEPFLSDTVEKNVTDNQITIEIIKNKGFKITNLNDNSVDLSGWFIILPDKIIELQPFTIIASKKSVLLNFSSFGIFTNYYENAQLQTPNRELINYNDKNNDIIVATSKVLKSNIIKYQNENIINTENYLAKSPDIFAENSDVENKKINFSNYKKIIFGALILLVITLFFIIERKQEVEQNL